MAMMANSNGVHNVRHRTSNLSSSGIGNERAGAGHASMGQGFPGSKPSWSNEPSIWAEKLGEKHSSENVLSGSGSLLPSSDVDGWTSRPNTNMPWATVNASTASSRASNNTMTTSPIQTRASERGVGSFSDTASYFGLGRSSGIGSASGSSQKGYLNTGADGISPSGEGLPFGPLGGFRNGERRHASNSAFSGGQVAAGFQTTKPGFSGPLDSPRSDEMTGQITVSSLPQALPDAVSKGFSRGAYSHTAHNSASFAPRAMHSAYPQFHSELDSSYANQPVDLDLDKLQLNDGSLGTQNGAPRPSYLHHQSFDSSFQRHKYSGTNDDASYAGYGNEGVPELQYSYQARGSRIDSPVSPTDYTRMESSIYSGFETSAGSGPHFRNASGSRMSDAQAAAYDRRLRFPADNDPGSMNLSRCIPYQSTLEMATRYPPNVGLYYPHAQYNVPGAGSRAHRDDSSTVRSAVLEEFRANNKGSKRYELKDIYNHVVEFSGDQHGSRFIQQKLETANSDEKEQVFREIRGDCLQLMTDVFGNYVVQKLFEHGNQTQKKILANAMKGHILMLSNQMYGCRVVQKALEHILTDQQAAMVKELELSVLKCVRDQNGNHVIQKAIERVPSEHIQFIINAFIGQVDKLATHPYGCRVIQRMLEHCKEEDRLSILSELHNATPKLISDQFGNYVIQHVIQNGNDEDKSRMIAIVMSNLFNYSKHKFASNVVEKSIEFGTESQSRQIITTLTSQNDKGENSLGGLVRDQFGNYVIQKILHQVKDEEYELLVQQLKPILVCLKKYACGKQISAIEKLIQEKEKTSAAALPAQTAVSTTPPHSHKSSPQPTKRAVSALENSRAPVVGAAPPTPPPTDSQSHADAAVESKTIAKSTVTPLIECESAGTMPNGSVEFDGTT